MSTTMITQLTGEPGHDLEYQEFAVVTVRENDAVQSMRKAIRSVHQDAIEPTGGQVDEIELRASLSSALKDEGLQMTGLQLCNFEFLGE